MHPAHARCHHISGLGPMVAPVQILLELLCHGLPHFLPTTVKEVFGPVPLGATTGTNMSNYSYLLAFLNRKM